MIQPAACRSKGELRLGLLLALGLMLVARHHVEQLRTQRGLGCRVQGANAAFPFEYGLWDTLYKMIKLEPYTQLVVG